MHFRCLFALCLTGFCWPAPLLAEPPAATDKAVPIFDGKTLEGWEGNRTLWQVLDGAISGGSLTETVKENDFLASRKEYGNFILRLKIKLTGTDGFINSGVQIRSQRVPNSSEMAGYQCDYGDPNWWGSIYDESRRNRLMAQSDMKRLGPVIKRSDWNDYVIKADGPRIQTWINGGQGVDYVEADENIVQSGRIGLQVHGGGKTLVQVKDITIEELPATPAKPKLVPAPPPAKVRNLNEGALSAADQQKLFTLPPGFELELVAEEQEGIGKFVSVAWDHHGRLWTMTALEYPVDANENRAAAEALYAGRGKDKVLVYDFASRGGADQLPTYQKSPQIFADGLAIPLGMLPYRDGAIVQHGKEVVFLRDTDGDGKADRREVLLEGVGIDDSHLFLHGFTRGPGNWIYTAQGAFNHSMIKAGDGSVTQWNFCKLGRFTPDGRRFELVAAGLNNIWGFVIDRSGRMWGQEANDLGYPVTPLAVGDNYPGIGDERLKPYAPVRPAPVRDWQAGGTGLSGLALQEDAGTWPEPHGPSAAGSGRTFYLANPITNRIQMTQAIDDGSSHFAFTAARDFVRCGDPWFRPVHVDFGPDGCLYIVDWYNKIISHNEVPRTHPERDKTRGRIWRVRHTAQKTAPIPDIAALTDADLRAFRPVSRWAEKTAWAERVDRGQIDPNTGWPRLDLRWELAGKSLEEMAAMTPAADGSYDVDFLRYMIRAELERRGGELAAFLDAAGGSKNPEFVLLSMQAMDGRAAAVRLAKLLPHVTRPLNDEELLRLAEFPDEPGVGEALRVLFSKAATLDALVRLKNRLDSRKLAPLLESVVRDLLPGKPDLGTRLVAGFQLKSLEPEVAAVVEKSPSAASLQTLRQVGSTRADLFLKLVRSPDEGIRGEALLCLAATPDKLLPLWKELNATERRSAVDGLTGTKPGAAALVAAVQSGVVPEEDLDGPVVEKLQMVLGDKDPGLAALLEKLADLFRPVLLLNGDGNAWVDVPVTLQGAFTVETWIRLDDGISNADGILGAPGVLDINFFASKLRVWVGGGLNDVIIAEKPVAAGAWTHVAVTRDAQGNFRLYLNGELDPAKGRPDPRNYANVFPGRTNVPQGTAGALTEYRIWNTCRTADEIRTNFDRLLERADGLALRLSGNQWGRLHSPARVAKTTDFPALMTPEQSAALDATFANVRALAEKQGDPAKGRLLAVVCTACHKIGDQGGQIGPNLSGVGAMGTEAILRNVLTPNAAMEAGYRVYQVQLEDGAVKEGFLAREDDQAVILRMPGTDDLRIAKKNIQKARHLKRSLMPEGLIAGFSPEMVTDLMAYLKTLK
ncbi:MAG: DUF1080 domain-containing protein [Verrucomicrobiales bacterium]|nr:DUF1080 domain-containing protein [Verrucomicrobiales bacterium]